MINLLPWPFREPRSRGVFTTRQVLLGIYPVLCIVHESGTGGWRFLDLMLTELEENMVGVTLETMVEFLDPEVLEEAIGLPLYSRSTRASVNDPWIRDFWDGRDPRKTTASRSGRKVKRG